MLEGRTHRRRLRYVEVRGTDFVEKNIARCVSACSQRCTRGDAKDLPRFARRQDFPGRRLYSTTAATSHDNHVCAQVDFTSGPHERHNTGSSRFPCTHPAQQPRYYDLSTARTTTMTETKTSLAAASAIECECYNMFSPESSIPTLMAMPVPRTRVSAACQITPLSPIFNVYHCMRST